MPRYRVLRDFGSHLGNHARGEHLTLPEGDLPRGFAGFVERVAEPATKDIRPAPVRADDVPPGAGPSSEASTAGDPFPSAVDDPPEPEEPPTPADRARAGYPDKMIRPKRGSR